MATKIKTLKDANDTVLPRTVADAVIMDDGTTLGYAIKNVSTDSVIVTEELADATGSIPGTKLSDFLRSLNISTANSLAAAEIID